MVRQISYHNHFRSDRDFLLRSSNFGNLVAFRAIFIHIFTSHAQRRLFMSFWWKVWLRHAAFDSLTPISLQWTIFRRFYDVFCWLLYWICWMSAIFLLSVGLYTDVESVSCISPLMLKIFTKFEVDSWYDHSLRIVLAAAYVTWPCDLGLWSFDLGKWSCMTGYMLNISSTFGDPIAIRFWVMSSDISHRIPLTMHALQ